MTEKVERLPWEKQPRESAPAFAAFAMYRDLGPQRTIAKAAAGVKKAVSTLNKWSSAHHWVDRADAYDHHVDRRRSEQMEESWRVANVAHRHIVGRIRESVNAKLDGDAARNISPLDPDDLDWGDIARLTREVIVLERLTHGQPTDFAARVSTISIADALDHVRLIIEIARRHMEPDAFRAFVLDYRAYNAVALERAPRQIGAAR